MSSTIIEKGLSTSPRVALAPSRIRRCTIAVSIHLLSIYIYIYLKGARHVTEKFTSLSRSSGAEYTMHPSTLLSRSRYCIRIVVQKHNVAFRAFHDVNLQSEQSMSKTIGAHRGKSRHRSKNERVGGYGWVFRGRFVLSFTIPKKLYRLHAHDHFLCLHMHTSTLARNHRALRRPVSPTLVIHPTATAQLSTSHQGLQLVQHVLERGLVGPVHRHPHRGAALEVEGVVHVVGLM